MLLSASFFGIVIYAGDIKVDLSKGTPGKPPLNFEPMAGTWIARQNGPDKIIELDGRNGA